MISSALSSWQATNGFRLENDTVYGVYNGVGFAVASEEGGKLFTFMLSGDDNAFDSLEDSLAVQRGGLRNIQVGDVEGYLALFFEENGGEMAGQLMTDLLNFVVANARGFGFIVPRVCVKCGAPANKRSFYNDMVQPMCTACSEEERRKKRASMPRPQPQPEPEPEPQPQPVRAADTLLPASSGYNPDEDDTYDQYGPSNRSSFYAAPQPETAIAPQPERRTASVPLSFANESTDQGSTGKGVIGALIGSFAGLVLLVISSMLGMELTCLCAAAGVGAVLGYIAFGGSKSKTTGLTVTLIASELLSVIMFVAINVVQGMAEGNDFGTALSNSVFTGALDYINLVIAVVTAALGIFVSLDTLANYISGDTGEKQQ